MAVDVQIRFRAESKQAKREIEQLQTEIQELRQQLGSTQKSADTAGNEIQQMGAQSRAAAADVDKLNDEAKAAQIGVTSLGRAVFKTSAEAKRFGGVFESADGRVREANGNFAKTRETINRIGDEARDTARDVDLLGDRLFRAGRGTTDFGRGTDKASLSSRVFSRALGGVGRVLAELGLTSAAHLIGRFIRTTIDAAGRLELLTTGLENVEGSSEAAQRRLEELDEIARLPGANLDALIQFSNRMRSIGISTEETDSILRNVGQSVVVLGGNAHIATEALEQISQALQKNTIIMHDFRPIIQRIPGFLQAVADVHGVEPTLDGMRLATERLGGSVKDALLPVLEELGNRFEAPPPESYVRSIDELTNSWFLLRAELGEKVLPVLAAGARGLANLFDGIREFIDTDEATRSAGEFAIALDKINSAASRHQAIEDRVHALRRLEIALKNERSGLSQSSEEYLDLSKQIQAAQNEQDRWNTLLERSPEAAAALETEIAGLNDQFQTLNQRLNQTEGTRTAASLAQTQRQFDQVSTSLSLANKLLGDVESGFQETTAATDAGSNATRGFISSVEDFGGVLSEVDTRFLTFHERTAAYQSTIRTLPAEITAVSDAFAHLNPFAAELESQFQDLNLSLRDATAEATALSSTIDAAGGPFAEYVAGLDATSVSADRAFGSINRVGEAVRDADFRRAEAGLRDFDDAFRLSEATIPRVTSEMRKFTGQVPAAAEEVVEFRRELENLNRTGQTINLSSVSDALNIGAAPVPGAVGGAREEYLATLQDIGGRIATELASQAIRTTSELRRIERDRVESLADLEQQYSDRIIAINEQKRQRLAEIEGEIEAERVRRLASIQQAFDDAKVSEIEARQDAADRILQIEADAAEKRNDLRTRLNDRIFELEDRRDARIQDLNDGLVEREQDRQQQIIEITERAAEARVAAETRYAEQVQEINNRLVEQVQAVQTQLQSELESLESGFTQRQADRADEIVRITQAAADARADANRDFTDTMEGVYRDLVTAWDTLEEGFTERQADRAQERVDIEQRAADARLTANETYAERLAEISTDLVDEIRSIEAEIIDVQQRHADERFAIEQETLRDRAEANTEYAERLQEIEADRERQLSNIRRDAREARAQADRDYADEFQGIQNDLVDSVSDIQRDLNATLRDLRDDQLQTEADQLQSRVDLHEETQQQLEDLERNRARTIQDLNQKLSDDIFDARLRAHRRIEDLNEASSIDESTRAERIAKVEEDLSRRIEDLTRDRNRKIADLGLDERRAREDLARETAEKEAEIAQTAASRITEIEQQRSDARSEAQAGIAEAESAAGVAFREAQENYVPALSAHEQALLEHTEALNRISQDRERATSDVTRASRAETTEASTTRREALSAISESEQSRLGTLDRDTAAALQRLSEAREGAETRAGLTFEEALPNYVPAVDLNTQALAALTAALEQTEVDRTSGLGALDAASAADRLSTQASQRALETGAGVSIEEARTNFVPALSSAAQATLTLNETLQELDTSFREAIAEIQEAGLVDRQALDTAVQTAIDQASSQISALETQAGTTFAEAAAAFRPDLSGIAQAGADRAAALGEIDRTERTEIGAVNAQSIADRLNTDAEVTATRDAYIKSRDTEILKHNTAILQLNLAEAADIREVKDALKVNLASINDNISVELAEIREQKVAFDTKMNELITAVNTQANQDVATLNADTAAMRTELEALAEEARNNAWKGAIAKMANVGITIAGVAAGTALGNPVAGLAIGQAVGGLVEQGANELFHFESTDAIARSLARQAAHRQPRRAPDYLPTPDQLRNARDVGREVVAGFTEGLAARENLGGGDSNPQQIGFPEEMRADVHVHFSDGGVAVFRDQVLRLQQQNRTH